MYKAKRALGQNFFINKTLAEKIVSHVISSNPEKIFEIGPGTGSFTSLLAQSGRPLTLIEKDNELAQYLGTRFPQADIINQDVLDLEVSQLVPPEQDLSQNVLFGSLPYNVSKKIIRKFLENPISKDLYFIVQKEVAEKYVASGSKNNLLSLTSRIYAKSKILLNISPGSFRPQPKVESAFIHFRVDPILSDLSRIDTLESLIKAAFTRPRKTVGNNLKGKFMIKNQSVAMQRPEDLTLEDYLQILEEAF